MSNILEFDFDDVELGLDAVVSWNKFRHSYYNMIHYDTIYNAPNAIEIYFENQNINFEYRYYKTYLTYLKLTFQNEEDKTEFILRWL